MLDRAYAVIMAGGRGERFWPLSTEKRPKQMLSLVGDRPLLAMAVDYLDGLIPPERVLVITSADLVDAACEAAPRLPRENVIGEPFGRDTAAACALGLALVRARDEGATFCVLTADHIIEDPDIFQATLRDSFALAQSRDVLVTIGMQPTFPSTGFGYIETGEAIATGEGTLPFWQARRFVEKPDLATAETYLASGDYYWNSGMFIWSTTSFAKALAAHQPNLLGMAERMASVSGTDGFAAKLEAEYRQLPKISVDYAIMENAGNIVMARGTFRWDDVGSWPALANHLEADAAGNVLVGRCETLDSRGNVVVSPDRLTALIGVSDLVVVQAGNATLVCPKDRAQDVKKLVQQLRDDGSFRDVL